MEQEYKVKLTMTHKLDFDHEYILDPRASIFLLSIMRKKITYKFNVRLLHVSAMGLFAFTQCEREKIKKINTNNKCYVFNLI